MSRNQTIAPKAPMAERPDRSHPPALTGSPPLFFLGHFLDLLAGLGETDGDGLLAAFHLAAFSALAALRFSSLVAVHLALHFGAGAARIFPFPLLGHKSLLDKRCRQNKSVAPRRKRTIKGNCSPPDRGTAAVRSALDLALRSVS